MSSLAGALDVNNYDPTHATRDVEMTSTTPKSEDEDEDEQMSDLFGNDNDVVEQRFV
jgi:hypothetical protein